MTIKQHIRLKLTCVQAGVLKGILQGQVGHMERQLRVVPMAAETRVEYEQLKVRLELIIKMINDEVRDTWRAPQ